MPGAATVTVKLHRDTVNALKAKAVAQGDSLNHMLGNLLQDFVTGAPLPMLRTPDGTPSITTKDARQQAMATLESAMPDLVGMLLCKAKEGDRESAIYCLDRLMGKPRQQVDQRILKVDASGEEFRAMVAQLLQSGGSKPPQIAPPSGTQTSEPLASEG